MHGIYRWDSTYSSANNSENIYCQNDQNSNDNKIILPLPVRGRGKADAQPWGDLVCANNKVGGNPRMRKVQVQHQEKLASYQAALSFVYGSYRYWNTSNQSLNDEYVALKKSIVEKTGRNDCSGPMSSLEILQDILHSSHGNEPSCFRANTKSTWDLVSKTRLTKQDWGLPILNVGFPKSGSTTLADFFRCAGGFVAGREQQGMCMHQAISIGCPPVSSCGHPFSQTYMQMDYNFPRQGGCFFPQIQFLDEIHAEYPNATFVMAIRPVDTWINSASHFNNMVQRWNRCKIPGLHRQNRNGGGYSHDDLQKWACHHVQHIRRFVQEYPSHALIEIDLYNRTETSTLMSQLFDADLSCWGHSNANPRNPTK